MIKKLDPQVPDYVDDFADFCDAIDNAIGLSTGALHIAQTVAVIDAASHEVMKAAARLADEAR